MPQSFATVPTHSHRASIRRFRRETLHQTRARTARDGYRARAKPLQICKASLTHDFSPRSSTKSCCGASQHSRAETHHADLADHDDDEHETQIKDIFIHKVLVWLFTSLGLLQFADETRGKPWAAILIAALMALALPTAWVGGLQWAQAGLFKKISLTATVLIYTIAGPAELCDASFDITAGHIDTHVLMTLAAYGTLAIGGALEVRS